jgi:hypothetical protein
MLYLYLDESGDLGFDFAQKKPSQFFTITILAVTGIETNRKLINAAKKTLKRKLNLRNHNKIHELKGSATTLEIKKYFFQQVRYLDFEIYSVSFNKKKLKKLMTNKDNTYNLMAKLAIDKILFREKFKAVELIVDKSKSGKEIEKFNQTVGEILRKKLKSATLVNIEHCKSQENFGLQICDLFCHGIFTKQERGEKSWLEIFEEKVRCNDVTAAVM